MEGQQKLSGIVSRRRGRIFQCSLTHSVGIFLSIRNDLPDINIV